MKNFLLSIVWLLVIAGELCAQQADDQTDKSEGNRPTVLQPVLRDELLALKKEDQDARSELVAAMNEARSNESRGSEGTVLLTGAASSALKRVSTIDKKSRDRMKEIIAEHGWPGRSLVGEEAAHAAWLLVQHADADVEFQKHCLELMKRAPAGEVAPKDIAYLSDRTLVAEGKEQLYGTQLNSNFEPKPISDPENVDNRRAEIGLAPLAEYIEQTKAHYRGNDKKVDEKNDGN